MKTKVEQIEVWQHAQKLQSELQSYGFVKEQAAIAAHVVLMHIAKANRDNALTWDDLRDVAMSLKIQNGI